MSRSLTGLRCPTCGYDRKADFDSYNLDQRRTRHAYLTEPLALSALTWRHYIKGAVAHGQISRDTARLMRAEIDMWAPKKGNQYE